MIFASFHQGKEEAPLTGNRMPSGIGEEKKQCTSPCSLQHPHYTGLRTQGLPLSFPANSKKEKI
ncbi:MAG: hypothetical protein R2795_10200 [Saprospiraceae bacterium]